MVEYNKRTIEISDDVARVLLKANVNVLRVFWIKEITKMLIEFNEGHKSPSPFQKKRNITGKPKSAKIDITENIVMD